MRVAQTDLQLTKKIADTASVETHLKAIVSLENAIKKLSTHLDENTKLQNELEGIMNSAEAVIS